MSQSCFLLLLLAGLPSMLEDVMEIFRYLVYPQHHLSHSCSGNVYLLRQGPHRPAGVLGDELVQGGGQDCSLIATYLALINVSADPPGATHLSNFNIFHHKQFFFLTSPLLKISFTVSPARSTECDPAFGASCWFIFARMRLFLFIYDSVNSRDGLARKNQ